MREDGRLAIDHGVFEINLSEEKISWANGYAIERTGYTLEQIRHMNLFDMISDAFHDGMQDIVEGSSEKKTSKDNGKVSIWPMKSAGGKVVWWAVSKTVTRYPIIWIYGDHIQTTQTSGMTFLFMQAFMKAANGQSGLYGKISELKEWTSEQISRLDEENEKLKTSFSTLESKMNDALSASKEAAEAAKTTHSMMETLQKVFQDFEAKYGAEILKLIGTDTIHDKRIDAFEKHVKLTTDLAVKSIEMQAKASSEGFSKQAAETSKGLSRKVVIPVSVIAAAVTIAQILVERYVR